MTRPTACLVSVFGLLALAGCTGAPQAYGPGYSYGPATSAYPPSRPGPVQIAPPTMITSSPLPPPGTFLPDQRAVDPLVPEGLPQVEVPPVRDPAPMPAEPAAVIDPAPAPAAASDPVTDILLAPPGVRAPAAATAPAAAPTPVLSKAPSPADGNPMMGFRPMRGQVAPQTAPQTAPTY